MTEQHDEPNVDENGYAIVRDVLTPQQIDDCRLSLRDVVESQDVRQGVIGQRRGSAVGIRNLIDHWPDYKRLVELSTTQDLVRKYCGPDAGLVRILFFDKPPGSGWALALHRDQTIAVKDHVDPILPFAKPTRKAGVPHVEATEHLLSRMLTLRFHLDAMHHENGPLTVIPGSHRMDAGKLPSAREVHCGAGDVFAMRPLLLHGSLPAASTTTDHRRVVHLEFAPESWLPGGYQWHRFAPLETMEGSSISEGLRAQPPSVARESQR
ncbi:MAG: phytanoyl-CoA dioxygenase family protein [Planctomycetota bacterium]